MTISDFMTLALIGTLAGGIAGFFGVGGGIVVVPALILIFGFSQHQAQGTSLAVLLLPVGLLAVYNYYKSGYVNVKYAVVILLFFVVGSYLSSLLAVHTPDKLLRKLFGLLMLYVGIRMMFKN